MYGTATWTSTGCCQCTATCCCCNIQAGTVSVTMAGNQIVWVIASSHDEREEPRIVLGGVRPRVPPPRYRRTSLQFPGRYIGRKTEVRRTGRERGHSFGHSPRRRSRH